MISYIQSAQLENIGFPKPSFQFGQKWYSKVSRQILIFIYFSDLKKAVFIDENFNTHEIDTLEELIFAPTLPEIFLFFKNKFSMQDLFVSVFQGDQSIEIENKVTQFILSTLNYSVP